MNMPMKKHLLILLIVLLPTVAYCQQDTVYYEQPTQRGYLSSQSGFVRFLDNINLQVGLKQGIVATTGRLSPEAGTIDKDYDYGFATSGFVAANLAPWLAIEMNYGYSRITASTRQVLTDTFTGNSTDFFYRTTIENFRVPLMARLTTESDFTINGKPMRIYLLAGAAFIFPQAGTFSVETDFFTEPNPDPDTVVAVVISQFNQKLDDHLRVMEFALVGGPGFQIHMGGNVWFLLEAQWQYGITSPLTTRYSRLLQPVMETFDTSPTYDFELDDYEESLLERNSWFLSFGLAADL